MELYNYVPFEDHTSEFHQGMGIVMKSIFLMVIICAGAIENAAVVYAIVKDRRLHKVPYYFVINLAIADLLRSVICLPFVQTTLIHGSRWQYGSFSCKLLAFASTFFIFGAAFALLVIAIERYLSVVHRSFHAKKLRGLMCLSIVLLGWGVAFILAFPPVFGLGTYDFNPLENQCIFGHQHYKNSDALGFVAIFLAIISVTLALYMRIFYFLRTRRRMKPIIESPPRSQTWNFVRAPQLIAVPANVVGPRTLTLGQPSDRDQGHLTSSAVTSDQPLLQPQLNNCIPMQHIHIHGCDQCDMPPRVNISTAAINTYCGFGSSPLRPVTRERLTRALFMVTMTYLVIWLPYIVATCCVLLSSHPGSLSPVFITVAIWLTYCQVALLPLVYIIFHRPVRHHVIGSPSIEDGLETEFFDQHMSIET